MKPITKALIGALPGAALAGYGTYQIGLSAPAYKTMNENLVDAKEIVKQHAPGVMVATAKKDLKQISKNKKDLQFLQKLLDYVKGKKNAVYISGKNAIISPAKVNKSLIGHEIGHSRDFAIRGHKPSDAYFQAAMEERGWKASPFQDEKSKALSKLMLQSYRGGDKLKAGAILAGVGVTVPSLLKLLKK